LKVDYYTEMYSRMRHGVFPHGVYITAANAHLLDGFDFAFVSMEGESKNAVIEKLERIGIAFIDVEWAYTFGTAPWAVFCAPRRAHRKCETTFAQRIASP